MISKLYSSSCFGIEACLIEVEVDVSDGLPQTTIVGLPDQAIQESKERVKSAIKNSDFPFSPKKITINLAPADLKKEGPCFDLAIALGILASNDYIQTEALKPFILIGELALDGSLRKVKGALPAATLAKQLGKHLIVPQANAEEAALEKGAKIFYAKRLAEVVEFLNGGLELPVSEMKPGRWSTSTQSEGYDFSEVKGQWHAKRAVEIAAAGNHNLLFIGPPGAGKTMINRLIPSILPPLGHEEALEISKIYSAAGLLHNHGLTQNGFIMRRPFRAPHHTISQIGLVGGGSFPRPGEITLAHGGVLFLDEFPEFDRDVIDALRGPLEEGRILISRVKQSIQFPARFMLTAAMNPCPCGNLSNPKKSCRCSLGQIQRYLNKISGPILDRIDLHVELPAIEYKDLASTAASESSEDIRTRIVKARAIQAARFSKIPISTNAEMNIREIKKFCSLSEDSKQLIEQAMKKIGFSARGYHKILKLSRTIADLAGSDAIQSEHVAEALQYRALDRNYFG